MGIKKMTMKLSMYSLIVISILLNVVFLITLFGRSAVEYIAFSSEEILRVTSPDGKVDAVIIQVGAPTTAEDTTEVFVVPKGRSVNWKRGDHYNRVFKGYDFQNLNIKWKEDKFLEIHYDLGFVWFFTNYIYPLSIDDPDALQYIVLIKETSTYDYPLPSN